MIDIKSMLPEELEAMLKQMGEPRFRAKQLFGWLAKGVCEFHEMSNLPKPLRDKLSETCFISGLTLLRKQVSRLDGTVKYLWELADGNAVETVVMRYHHGATVCISSQVGCRMGCAFCASTIGGLVRNLRPAELLDEVLYSQMDFGEPVSHIVLMGIGEPLDNYENIVKFLKLVNHPDGLNFGMRHISLSTCGLTERIADLAKEGLQLTLALSLHAPDDATRSRLVPANKGRGVEQLLQCCQDYFNRTGRRITFEYTMIDGVNDSVEQAVALARLAKRAKAHINLIPLNHVEERELSPSKPEQMKQFCAILAQNGANYTLRRSLGGDIDSSCGQLRRRQMERN